MGRGAQRPGSASPWRVGDGAGRAAAGFHESSPLRRAIVPVPRDGLLADLVTVTKLLTAPCYQFTDRNALYINQI